MNSKELSSLQKDLFLITLFKSIKTLLVCKNGNQLWRQLNMILRFQWEISQFQSQRLFRSKPYQSTSFINRFLFCSLVKLVVVKLSWFRVCLETSERLNLMIIITSQLTSTSLLMQIIFSPNSKTSWSNKEQDMVLKREAKSNSFISSMISTCLNWTLIIPKLQLLF